MVYSRDLACSIVLRGLGPRAYATLGALGGAVNLTFVGV